jgi:DHA1 family tetracycline resistance protein-like MFS transporter
VSASSSALPSAASSATSGPVFGIVLSVASFALTGLASRSWMVFAIIIVSAPCGVAMPAMNAWMSKLAPDDAQGRLQGSIGAAESLSSIIGPILMSQVFGA